MSNDAGGYPPAGPPAAGLSAAGLPAARLSTPATYPPPGYQPATRRPAIPAYPPPGYPGYPPGYPPPGYAAAPPALKPGVIPLRPLTLTDIFNGAFAYIRANPKATLGLTTVVVVIAQIIALILQIGPLAATGNSAVLQRRGGVDGRGTGFVRLRARQRGHHPAVVDPAQRHAHRHRGPRGVRRGHHHRRGMATGPRATARR